MFQEIWHTIQHCPTMLHGQPGCKKKRLTMKNIMNKRLAPCQLTLSVLLWLEEFVARQKVLRGAAFCFLPTAYLPPSSSFSFLQTLSSSLPTTAFLFSLCIFILLQALHWNPSRICITPTTQYPLVRNEWVCLGKFCGKLLASLTASYSYSVGLNKMRWIGCAATAETYANCTRKCTLKRKYKKILQKNTEIF